MAPTSRSPNSEGANRAWLQQKQAMQQRNEGKLKLTLWYTIHFVPIINHRSLELVMSTLGFVGLPPSKPRAAATVAWREYVYPAGGKWRSSLDEGQNPPKLKLPFPFVDGLHISTYQAFLDAVEFYLDRDISDVFHVRADTRTDWSEMEGEEDFLYRAGTLDLATSARNSLDMPVARDSDTAAGGLWLRRKRSAVRLSYWNEEETLDDVYLLGLTNCNLLPSTDINATLAGRTRSNYWWSMGEPNQFAEELGDLN